MINYLIFYIRLYVKGNETFFMGGNFVKVGFVSPSEKGSTLRGTNSFFSM